MIMKMIENIEMLFNNLQDNFYFKWMDDNKKEKEN